MGVEEMQSVCTGVADITTGFNRVAGLHPIALESQGLRHLHNIQSNLTTTSGKDILKVVGSILDSPFYKYAT